MDITTVLVRGVLDYAIESKEDIIDVRVTTNAIISIFHEIYNCIITHALTIVSTIICDANSNLISNITIIITDSKPDLNAIITPIIANAHIALISIITTNLSDAHIYLISMVGGIVSHANIYKSRPVKPLA